MKAKQQPNWLSAVFTMVILLAAFGLMSVQEKKAENRETEKQKEIMVDLDPKIDSTKYLGMKIYSKSGIDSLKARDDKYLTFSILPSNQDTVKVSEAIVDLVQNRNSFEVDYDLDGQIKSISKDGKSIEGQILNVYKAAWNQIEELNSQVSQQKNDQAMQKEVKMRARIVQQQREALRLKVEAIELKNKSISEKTQMRELQLRLLEVNVLQRDVYKEIAKIQNQNEVLDSMQLEELSLFRKNFEELNREYERLSKIFHSKRELLSTSSDDQKLIEAQLEKELLELQQAGTYNEQIERELIKRQLIEKQSQQELILKGLDGIPGKVILELNGQLIPDLSLSEINMQRIKNISVVKGEDISSVYPNEKLEGYGGVIRITTDPTLSAGEQTKISKTESNPAIVLNGQLIRGKKLSDINLQNVTSFEVIKGKSMYKFMPKEELEGYDGMIRIYTPEGKDNPFYVDSISPDNQKYYFNGDSKKEAMYDLYITGRYNGRKKILIEYEGKLKKNWTIESLKEDKLQKIQTIQVLTSEEMAKYQSKKTLEGIDVLLRVNSKN